MASPQLENGYVRISTELFEALIKTRIPGEQRQVLDFIIRMSYGYQKKDVDLLPGDISRATGVSRQNVYRAIKGLIEKRILCVVKKDYRPTTNYHIQKDYKKWRCSQKRDRVSKKRQSVVKKETTPIKDNKDNNVVLETIEYLNLKTGKKFQPKTQSTIKFISGRIRDGYSPDDLKNVIDIKTAEWKDDKKMAQYLCPSTLFNPTNFEKYINQTPIIEHKEEYIRAPKGYFNE